MISPVMIPEGMGRAARFLPFLEKYMPQYGINTPLRIAHFLAQVGHESAGFSKLRENMNYGSKRLLVVFGKYFTKGEAASFANKPRAIANRVYANRLGNGSAESNDSWNFRGGGLMHLTGKKQYEEASQDIFGDDRLVKNPELIETPEVAVLTAIWWWNKNNMNAIADMGKDVSVVKRATRRVNGSFNGLDDRIARFNKAIMV